MNSYRDTVPLDKKYLLYLVSSILKFKNVISFPNH